MLHIWLPYSQTLFYWAVNPEPCEQYTAQLPSKPEHSSLPNPRIKQDPATAVVLGFFFLYPLSTILDAGLLNVMEGGVRVPDYITLQLLRWGQCQLPWQFYCLYYEPNWTLTNLHRQIRQQLLVLTRPRAGSRSLVGRVCVRPSLARTFAVSIRMRVLKVTSLTDIV